ncbi:hypothetical protein Chelonae_p4447 [[Mycobacterium] chelonae subsp. bovistauri]|nr:hypothetical protein Chelonae_p4447 [Mycobacterium sp. QIA-37]
MSDLAALLAFIHQVSGTPYISGGDSARGTDCSGLASWVSNVATDRPAFGSRFNTGNQERALLARGFKYGTAPGALVIGWNGGHTAVTLPDGTAVSSGGAVASRSVAAAPTRRSSSGTCTCRWTMRVRPLRWMYPLMGKVPR